MMDTKKSSYKQLALTSLIVAGGWSAANFPARAQSSNDPYATDVLGFRLGMTSEEVKSFAPTKIPDAVFDVKQGILSMGSFKTAPMVFGVTIAPKDALYGKSDDKEIIKILFDTRPPYKAIDISRHRVYTQNTASQIAQTIDALTAKYGQPASHKELGTAGTELYFSWNTDVKYSAFADSKAAACILALSEINLAGQNFSGSFNDNRDASLRKCGAWMRVRLIPLQSNPALLGQIFVEFGDVKAMRESELFILDALKKGGDAAASGERAKASANKPDL